jgi:hypothetical protein
MKKHLLFIGAIALSSFSIKAQITVSSTNLVEIGDLVIQTKDTSTTITVSAPGPTQTWNLSGLLDQRQDTLTAVDPATTPNASDFPTANIALYSNSTGVSTFSGSGALYAIKTASSFDFIGLSINGSVANQQVKLIDFPATYGTSFNSPISTFVKVSGADVGQPAADSIKYISVGTKKSSMDAWGTLTTPLGSFSTIRQNDTTITSDTAYALYGGVWILLQANTDTSYQHQFWTDDASANFPLLTYEVNAAGLYVNKSATWLQTFSPASIDESSIKKLSLYPNPSNDVINFNIEENISGVIITDMAGRVVYNTKSNRKSVSITNLSDGVYKVTVSTGNRFYTSQFIKR